MKVKKMSELLPYIENKCIYLRVGEHADKPLDTIMEDKEKEIDKARKSFFARDTSLWERIASFCENEENIYVIMVGGGKPPQGGIVKATKYIDPNKESKEGEGIDIPLGIEVTYHGSCASALVVEEYYKIDPEDNCFYTGYYTYIRENGTEDHFNGTMLLTKSSNPQKKNKKNVAYVAKLKPPFSVKIK